MAHFARVLDNTVMAIHVVANDVITDDDGVEQEQLGKDFLAELYGYDPDEVIQCSYNANFRGIYPGIGFSYDPVADVFALPVTE
jgi:hypothetical protein